MSEPINKEKGHPSRNWFLTILFAGAFIFSSYFQVIYKSVVEEITKKKEKDLEQKK